MKFEPGHYYEASLEHSRRARKLLHAGDYPAATYYGGLAVECMLRAFRTLDGGEFDEKHDLRKLMKSSRFGDNITSAAKRKDIHAAFSEVWSRWKNNYRYASEGRLEKEIQRLKANQRLKRGTNLLKHHSSILVENSLKLVARGEIEWSRKKT